jgi:Tol biopolymer transport system component
MTEYAEFRIRIEPDATPGSYRVEATGLGGDARGAFESPFSDDALENFVLKVGRTRRGVRKLASPEWESAKTFGGRLFSSVMQGRVLELYREALSGAQAAKKPLRVTLALSQAPELAEIPWEYLYDPPNFLSISASTPVVRYLDVSKPVRPVHVELPIRILAVVSAPSDAEELKAGEERSKLETALQPLIEANAVAIDWLEGATLLALAKKLRPDTYHILHFIGHGGFDDANQEGALLFEDETGHGSIVSGEQLATVLNDKTSLQLVFLNSCEGARTSRKDPFAGVAASLIEREIPAVIAMQFEITDRAAILFAGDFYAALAEGRPVDVAVTQARLTIFADQNDVEWGTPVLFMRVADGQLFDIADASTLPRVPSEILPPKVAVPVPVAAGNGAGRGTGSAGPLIAAPPVALPAVPVPRRPVPWRLVIAGVAIVAVLLIGAGLLLRPTNTGSMTVLPGGAEQTGLVQAIGSGFAPGELVDIYLDGVPATTVTAGADGAFTTPVTVGTKRTGRVSAFGRTSGHQVNTDFEVPFAAASSSASASEPAPSATSASSAAAITPVGGPPGILFYSNADPESSETDYEVYMIDPVTGEETPLTHNTDINDTFPTWSPDYTQIAFARTVNGSRDIFIMDLHGNERPLTSGDADDWFPAWSTQGLIAFVRTNPGESGSSIRAIRPDGTDEIDILSTSGHKILTPAWTVDGRTLALTTDLFGTDYDVTAVEADGLGLRQLSTGGTSDRNPTWSADGRTILFVHDQKVTGTDTDNDLYLLDVATQRVTKRLTDNDVQDGNPVWSPDGGQIAFYRASGKGYHLWVMNKDGTGARDLMPTRPGRNLDPNWR